MIGHQSKEKFCGLFNISCMALEGYTKLVHHEAGRYQCKLNEYKTCVDDTERIKHRQYIG
mgnify:CR=1 FL=1